MKKSELITSNMKLLAEAMAERYRYVLEADGRIQYTVYIWSDGELEMLQDVQGGSTYLKPKDCETRKLYYVHTVESPYFDPWDCLDHSPPEDETEREAERAFVIEALVEEYENTVYDLLENIADAAEREEREAATLGATYTYAC